MSEATKTIESSLSVESIRRGSPWIYFDDYQERYTTVISTLGRECRDWAEGETDRAVDAIISEHCSNEDAIVFTDGSVRRSNVGTGSRRVFESLQKNQKKILVKFF